MSSHVHNCPHRRNPRSQKAHGSLSILKFAEVCGEKLSWYWLMCNWIDICKGHIGIGNDYLYFPVWKINPIYNINILTFTFGSLGDFLKYCIGLWKICILLISIHWNWIEVGCNYDEYSTVAALKRTILRLSFSTPLLLWLGVYSESHQALLALSVSHSYCVRNLLKIKYISARKSFVSIIFCLKLIKQSKEHRSFWTMILLK